MVNKHPRYARKNMCATRNIIDNGATRPKPPGFFRIIEKRFHVKHTTKKNTTKIWKTEIGIVYSYK